MLRGGSSFSPAFFTRSDIRFPRAIVKGEAGFRVVCVPSVGQSAPNDSAARNVFHLQPVAPQTVEVGKQLKVAVSVEDAERWKGRLRFTLDRSAPIGARIDPETGTFTWTPTDDQAPRKCDVVVSVEGPEGRKAETVFSITVTSVHPPAQKEIAFDLGRGVMMEFVLIPAGSFVMGWRTEVPIAQPFYLGKYEVTQEQWQVIMGTNPSAFKDPKNPVEMVNWHDCQSFVRKLNEKHANGAVRFSLPTEADWEYACRAGNAARGPIVGLQGAKLRDYAWYYRNSAGRSHPVGQKKPNAWGLYDMYGNVWEWCADSYVPRMGSQSHAGDPIEAATGGYRVLRGGCWSTSADLIDSAHCHGSDPNTPRDTHGFRVAGTRLR